MSDFVQLSFQGAKACVQLAGAQMASYKTPQGWELMWQADPAVWPEHAPILFPICGAAKGGEVIIDGKSYPMNKHGFTRLNPVFEIDQKGEDFVDLILKPNDLTRSSYPFEFEFHVRYSLYPNGFRTEFQVINRDEKNMPFCVGGHPAFNCPMEDGAVFEDYDVIFEKDEDGKIARVPGGGLIDGMEDLPIMMDHRIVPLNHDEIDSRDSWLFSKIHSRSVRLVNRNTGKGLKMDFPKMEALAIWSMGKKKADYICLEPWHGIPATVQESGKMEDKAYATILSPGESYVTWYDVTLDL